MEKFKETFSVKIRNSGAKSKINMSDYEAYVIDVIEIIPGKDKAENDTIVIRWNKAN